MTTSFKEFIGESQIFEMANIDPKIHKFGIDVKIHILQPGNRKLPHGPRLKIFKSKESSFIITLPKDIRDVKVEGKINIVKNHELKTLIDIAKHYKEAFVSFWCNDDMGVGELMDFIEYINKNNISGLNILRSKYPITCY